MHDPREHVDELIEHLDRWDVDTRTCLEFVAQALEGIVDRLDDLDRTLSFIRPTDDHPGSARPRHRHPALDAKTDDTLSRPLQLDLESIHTLTGRFEDEDLKDLVRCMATVIHSQHQRLDALENRSNSNRTAVDELGHIVTDFITRTKTQIDDFLRINKE